MGYKEPNKPNGPRDGDTATHTKGHANNQNGLNPPKTNWARPITEPPFYGYALRPGVTFTYLGLRVDHNAQVQGPSAPVENLWAAGEIMAGSILGKGCPWRG